MVPLNIKAKAIKLLEEKENNLFELGGKQSSLGCEKHDRKGIQGGEKVGLQLWVQEA